MENDFCQSNNIVHITLKLEVLAGSRAEFEIDATDTTEKWHEMESPKKNNSIWLATKEYK